MVVSGWWLGDNNWCHHFVYNTGSLSGARRRSLCPAPVLFLIYKSKKPLMISTRGFRISFYIFNALRTSAMVAAASRRAFWAPSAIISAT